MNGAAESTARAAHPAHLVVLGGLPLEVFRLDHDEIIAGRSPDLPLRLDHLEVSRQHCRFRFADGVWTVQDLNSQWGTRVTGVGARTALPLAQGDRVQVASIVLLFGLGDPPSQTVFEKMRIGSLHEAAPVMVRGLDVTRIPLEDKMILGRDPDAEVFLNDPAVSRRHGTIARTSRGFRVSDARSTSGSFVNGHRFDEHLLTIGDRLQIGPYLFQFDGEALNHLSGAAGGTIEAFALRRQVGRVRVLDGISLRIDGSRFAGIIGPSGAGKSSLLEALSGMRAPAAGQVRVDEADVYGGKGEPSFGYVPQQDIVHGELTVRAALVFGARLRLPRGTASGEMNKLVDQTIAQLGLEGREQTPVARLSGGQRKRVSVGVELLARPAVLFLDEPSSGLDPATEFKLMELLRALADSGCTIVCTTHVVENLYLLDQLLVVHRGRLLYSGPPQEAREAFGVQRISSLYEVLEETPADQLPRIEDSSEPPAAAQPMRPKQRPALALPILLARQWAILRADRSNFLILFGQPLLIAALVAWASDDASLALFFACIATLWFGCSNASQEIVRELPIYHRERVIGLGRGSYLATKLVFLGGITLLQSLVLFTLLELFEWGLAGAAVWQMAGLLGLAVASVAIGLAISALARTLLQAVLIVPLLLIPLILFSGYTVPAADMKPRVYHISRLMPSFAAQRVMDLSFLWHREVSRQVLSDHMTAMRNLKKATDIRTGDIYRNAGPGLWSIFILALWTLAGTAAAWLGLRAREH